MVVINDRLYFTADRLQFTLWEKCTRIDKETGEEYEDKNTIGYYTSVAGVLRGARMYMIRKKIENDEITSLDEVIAEIQRMIDNEKELFKELES